MVKYNFKKIERKWQNFWEKEGFYQPKDFDKKPKKYILIEFPYPSGDGLHVGHVRSYSALDALARKKRMEGYNVLYPIGWDAFGLPTENYAIKKGIHPSIITKQNIAVFKRQLKSLGLSFDWTREINTTDPDYYKWTQWIFLQFFKRGLAYQAEMPINWCPKCKIGLANEEVVSGKCERCGAETERRTIKQWMLKITKYADRLIEDLDKVDYSEKIKTQQINWIGRSEGTEVDFKIADSGSSAKITVFTTRIDTLFGVTALVISPEHPLTETLTTKENRKKVKEYIEASKKKSDLEREENKEKTGVFTGSYCINPANEEKVPIWVGDYVVATYGGGAVMMVPSHDYRDYDFAKKYNLPIKKVVIPSALLHMTTNADTVASGGKAELRLEAECFVDDGELINSGNFNGLSSEKAREEITRFLEKKEAGKKSVKYKLRDWIFSRQHYWGEPIPIIHCEKCGIVPVPEYDLPVELPYVKKYKPTNTGESPLASIKKWVNVKCPKCKGKAKRETDTMPNWAGSSWYFLRYIDPKNGKKFADFKKLKYWLPIDLYNGGMEHTTLHLLYSRFWHKFLYDLKLVPTLEAYSARRSHGMVLAEDAKKMSKSLGNVINPDEIVKKFGADTLRMYEMFMGPFDQAINWSNQGVVGVFRFLNRVWQLQKKVKKDANQCRECETILHKSVKKLSEDIDNMKFNTAVSQLMILINEMDKEININLDNYKIFLKLLAPLAPHISEELWAQIGEKKSIHLEGWPKYDPAKIKENTFDLVIQINGKMRLVVSAPTGIKEEEAKELALSQERIKRFLSGKTPMKIIYISGKLINIVI
ncbi:MAG: leucine--tRNA ligase [Candidatus Tagabacteria bacterium CG_4_9_14_0_2_um_filter_41_11]|uniref:Leucine--tRNA ligase n=1 Tax=Candidatus Tagabacteria bacterium CG_4_9_14_0_2_um_filter_41_11 TaxID=1975019 RepID=A0A2M8ERQ8_9BACT|nr:MAG: leucine--tRNA ligase [Candidatus Tagabacteria bacterium CG_4_9_14_0_2_um_filter_41_11]